MKKLCVYTCITGDYDNLHEIEHPEKNIDYYCFTNSKNLKSKTWKIIQIQNNGLTDHLLSRKIKMLGHPAITENYTDAIWMDASVVWDKKISDFIKTYVHNNTSFAAFKHNARTSIKDEAVACLQLDKDSKDKIIRTLDFLKRERFPDNLGLYEMTVFYKNQSDPKVVETMELWFNTIRTYSRRDQLSFMYAIWKTGLNVTPINLNIWDNSWFHTLKHTTKREIKNCHIYYGEPDQNFDFNRYFIYQYAQTGSTYHLNTVIPNDAKEIEINPCNIIGTVYQNISITPKPTNILYFGQIPYHSNTNVFCTSHNTIRIYGNFKKRQKFSFSIDMEILDKINLDGLVEKLWFQYANSKNQLESENALLKSQNAEIQNALDATSAQLQHILNSKTWKALRRLKKIIPSRQS